MNGLCEVAGCVQIGKGKNKCDDRLLVNECVFNMETFSKEIQLPILTAVCDGVGGYSGGDEAAQFVLNSLSIEWQELVSNQEHLKDTLCDLNSKLIEEGLNKKYTTISGMCLLNDSVIFVNAGDSRVYRLRGGILCRMTEDDSSVQDMINRGMAFNDNEQALKECSIITKCIGKDTSMVPRFSKIDYPPIVGDIFIVCSDGLWSYIDEKEIAVIISNEESIRKSVSKLIDKAVKNGSNDDISVCIIRLND